eukprot:6192563-Prymnesium_polylepis.2
MAFFFFGNGQQPVVDEVTYGLTVCSPFKLQCCVVRSPLISSRHIPHSCMKVENKTHRTGRRIAHNTVMQSLSGCAFDVLGY